MNFFSVVLPRLAAIAHANNNTSNETRKEDVATALFEAYSALSCCCILYVVIVFSCWLLKLTLLIQGDVWYSIYRCRCMWILYIRYHTLQELQGFNCACMIISKSTVIKYYQLLSKVIGINGKLCFVQLATAFFSTPP